MESNISDQFAVRVIFDTATNPSNVTLDRINFKPDGVFLESVVFGGDTTVPLYLTSNLVGSQPLALINFQDISASTMTSNPHTYFKLQSFSDGSSYMFGLIDADGTFPTLTTSCFAILNFVKFKK